MGTEVITYSRIGKEDIRFGKGTFEVVLADGRKVTINEVDIGALLTEFGISSATNQSYVNGDQAQTTLYMKPDLVSLSGVQQQFGIGSEMLAGDGGTGVARVAIVGMVASNSTNTNQMYAATFIAQQSAGTTTTKLYGIEVDVNVNTSDDPINPASTEQHIGIAVVSAGSFQAGPAAITIGSSNGQTNAWHRGLYIGINQIVSGGFAIHYLGDGTNGPFIVTSECKLYLGVDGQTNVSAGDMCIQNGSSLRSENAAGNDSFSLIKGNSSDRVEIGAALQMPSGVVATASLPAAAAGMDGTILIEDAGAGDRNLIIYAGGERFRIDGGAAF